MVNQNKIFSFEIKRQAKNIFPRDVERTVVSIISITSGDDFKYQYSALYFGSGSEVIKLFICSTQLSMKFHLVIK